MSTESLVYVKLYAKKFSWLINVHTQIHHFAFCNSFIDDKIENLRKLYKAMHSEDDQTKIKARQSNSEACAFYDYILLLDVDLLMRFT